VYTQARTLAGPALEAHSLNRLSNWQLNQENPGAALAMHQAALSVPGAGR
jgi:hypothetical protein